MNSIVKRKLMIGLGLFLMAVFLLYLFEVYVPKFSTTAKELNYTLKEGTGSKEIANELKDQGIIKNSLFFRLYSVISGKYSRLQAGRYELSSSMSIADIVDKLAVGDILSYNITLIEGWNIKDMAEYLESENFYSSKVFLDATKKDWSQSFSFLKDKPKGLNLEGYIFPDTYKVHPEDEVGVLIEKSLNNFDRKLTADLRQEISKQNKSIFKVITMASILEKEAKTLEDKKVISGILWKRLKVGMALQVDATVNFVTGKSDSKVSIADTKIDSPYNTYKYAGLPLGPISNPGIDSILAAIYPIDSPYWYYIAADGTGETIFSKTLEEHAAAINKYFK